MTHLLAFISQSDGEKNHLFLASYLKCQRKIKHKSVLFPASFSNHFQQAPKSEAEVF